jgi:SAM-dependent methyltransferase
MGRERAMTAGGGDLPDWRLPEGVDRALWAYVTSERLAADEGSYFGDHPLFRADMAFVREVLGVLGGPLRVADLGCGTGRAALAIGRDGHEVTAVDLSAPMLARVGAEARRGGQAVRTVRANLCDLGCLPDGSHDAALMLFSTLGMVRGRPARRRALAEAARVVRPGGWLILHAHNLWANLRWPGGRRWLVPRLPRILVGRGAEVERPMTYRGIPNLVVHAYRPGELSGDLRWAGWRVRVCRPIEPASGEVSRWPRGLAGSWLMAAERGR